MTSSNTWKPSRSQRILPVRAVRKRVTLLESNIHVVSNHSCDGHRKTTKMWDNSNTRSKHKMLVVVQVTMYSWLTCWFIECRLSSSVWQCCPLVAYNVEDDSCRAEVIFQVILTGTFWPRRTQLESISWTWAAFESALSKLTRKPPAGCSLNFLLLLWVSRK